MARAWLLALFILLPLAQAVLLSLTLTLPRDGMAEGTMGLMNYAAVLAAPELRASMLSPASHVTLNVALCITLGLPAAYALARFRFVGDRHVMLALLVFRVTPPVVLSLPIFILFSRLGQEDRKACHSLLAVLRAHSPQPGRVELHLQLLRWSLRG